MWINTKTFKPWKASCYYVFVLHIVQKLLILGLDFLYDDLTEILIQKGFLDKHYEHTSLVKNVVC